MGLAEFKSRTSEVRAFEAERGESREKAYKAGDKAVRMAVEGGLSSRFSLGNGWHVQTPYVAYKGHEVAIRSGEPDRGSYTSDLQAVVKIDERHGDSRAAVYATVPFAVGTIDYRDGTINHESLPDADQEVVDIFETVNQAMDELVHPPVAA